jgi:hypothetical protein
MAVRPSSSFVSVTHDASRELRADREAADACAHVCVRERERERGREREREREREKKEKRGVGSRNDAADSPTVKA